MTREKSKFDTDLEGLSSAEEFFAYFAIGYEAQILAASRLHILKQFHKNLADISGLDSLDEAPKKAAYRRALSEAYARFVAGNALTERVFPRLQAAKGAFVALSSLAMPNTSGRPPVGRSK